MYPPFPPQPKPISGQLNAAQCSSAYWTSEDVDPPKMLDALKNGAKALSDQSEVLDDEGQKGVIQLLEAA
jgi:hypothetical protein